MAKRKNFPLRLSLPIHEAVARWAEDELRSVNGQIEYLLLAALRREGRWRGRGSPDEGEESASRSRQPES